MTRRVRAPKVVQAWLGISEQIEEAIRGLSEEAIDLRGGEEGWSIRENVHHLVEANLVATGIMVAALAKSGCTFDWSWLNPDAAWMRRIGYDKAPIRPALGLLRALGQHLAGLIGASEDRLRREVRLLDAPGAKLYRKTAEKVLRDEVGHAKHHLADVARIRAAHGQ